MQDLGKQFTLSVAAILALLIITKSSMAAQVELEMVVSGSREQVLEVIAKSMDEEFSDGARAAIADRVGYKIRFGSMGTGQSEVAVALSPLVKADENKPSAHLLNFGYQTQRNSVFFDGTNHVSSLQKKIANIGPAKGVIVIADRSPYRRMFEQADRCYSQITSSPQLATIARKVALDGATKATLVMLTDDSKPTEQEKAEILQWAGMVDTCFQLRKADDEYFPHSHRGFLVLDLNAKFMQLTVELYKGNISYGEYVAKRKESSLSAQRKDAETSASINKQQIEEQAQLDRQRQLDSQRSMEMLAQQLQAQQQARAQAQRDAEKAVTFSSRNTRKCVTTKNLGQLETTCSDSPF